MRATLQVRRRLHLLWSALVGFAVAVVALELARRTGLYPAPGAGAFPPDGEHAFLTM